MAEIWSKKSRLWKFTAVYLIVFELLFLISLIFFYNNMALNLHFHFGSEEEFMELWDWYGVYLSETPPYFNEIFFGGYNLQPISNWGMAIMWISLVYQEHNQRRVWKKGLLEFTLFFLLAGVWFVLLLPHLKYYRLFHVMMSGQILAVPLLLQLATHPDLPQEPEPE